jgi:hypothetical protein
LNRSTSIASPRAGCGAAGCELGAAGDDSAAPLGDANTMSSSAAAARAALAVRAEHLVPSGRMLWLL